MEKDKGFRVLAIVALCIAVAGLSIGYASLNRELNITGTATKSATSWDVHFKGLSQPTKVGTGNTVTDATLNATTVTVDVSVLKPGDSVTYTFSVENSGDIDAKLNAVPIITGADVALTNDVIVSLTHADGTALAANETLASKTSTELKLSVVYDAAAETIASTEVKIPISATLLYVQK